MKDPRKGIPRRFMLRKLMPRKVMARKVMARKVSDWRGLCAMLLAAAAAAAAATGATAATGAAATTGATTAAATGAARAEDCTALTALKIDHVTLTHADVVAAGAVTPSLTEAGAPAVPVAYCRVQALSTPTADSLIRFELWIPISTAWNGKFEQLGNGGFAGAIPYRWMANGVAKGYAVAGTDDGHQSSESTDAAWALNHPEKIEDYGWRAIKETALASKRILQGFKHTAAAKSYFLGCSDGGREALMMAQRYPTYFDGILAGAPAYAMTRLLTGGALRTQELTAPGGHLSAVELALLQKHALASCGNGAGYLSDPRRCTVDLSSLQCAAEKTDACLTEPQIHTARLIYEQRTDPATGKPLYAVLPGAEAVKGSWDSWLTGTDDQRIPAAVGFSWNYLAFMVMNEPKLDIATVTEADIIRGAHRYAPIIDSENPDLSAFRAHGGKLIQYHGWNDPGIPPGYSVEYHDRVAAKTASIDDFYRLFMVPGMLHCAGGDAPTQVNWQAALEAWVEKGSAPGTLVATDGRGASQTLAPYGMGSGTP